MDRNALLMQAIRLERYGDIGDVRYVQLPVPQPRHGEVLIRVHAAAVNDWDLGMIRAQPAFMRLFLGLAKPRFPIPGVDISGVVVAADSQVNRFKPGDAVFGDLSGSGFGAFAEYVAVPEHAVEKKPASITHIEAATLPHATGLAVQGIVDMGRLAAGQSLLINGAAGGVGAIGIQYAKMIGATVTGVDRQDKLDFMRKLGCDQVIDYTRQDFTKSESTYDLILDNKTRHHPRAYARTLKPGGLYLSVGGDMFRVLQVVALARYYRLRQNRRLKVLPLEPNTGLAMMADLVDRQLIRPAVGPVFPLSDTVSALRVYDRSEQTGRIVIKVCD